MKLIERPDKEILRKLTVTVDGFGSPERALAKYASDVYEVCCSHYEKELERIQKLLTESADQERILRELLLIKNELIRMREERDENTRT